MLISKHDFTILKKIPFTHRLLLILIMFYLFVFGFILGRYVI